MKRRKQRRRGRVKRPIGWNACRQASVILCASNEERSISAVLKELKRLPFAEIIIVVNGSTDRTFELCKEQKDCTILHYPEALGHDVGRAVGARYATSEILLFADADFVIPAAKAAKLVRAIARGGLDIALNDIQPYLPAFYRTDAVTQSKILLNRVLGRSDLGGNSLTAVPHAMSRSAMLAIGAPHLAVPPLAQAIAVRKGLRIGSPVAVNVITKNRLRSSNRGSSSPVAELIVGDHLEALAWLQEQTNPRYEYADAIRDRSKLGEIVQ